MRVCKYILLVTFTGLSACSLFQRHGSYDFDESGSEVANYYNEKKSEDWERAKAQLGRNADSSAIEQRLYLNHLEKQINTEREKILYYKYKPSFPTDSHRIAFLQTQGFDGKSEWLRRNKINSEEVEYPVQIQDLINNNDICLGMSRKAVQDSWGEPDTKAVSGKSLYGNERWSYTKTLSGEAGFTQEVRYVYFEGGLVVGWEKQ